MIKTQSGRFLAIRNKSRRVDSKAPTMPARAVDSRAETGYSTPALSKTPEELAATPMRSSATLKSLDKHQHTIRKLHHAFMRETNPYKKKLIATARDRMLTKITHEDRKIAFVESMVRFNSMLVEMDADLRALERASRERPDDEGAFSRYSRAAVRQGKPEPKHPKVAQARKRLAVLKKFTKSQKNPATSREGKSGGQRDNPKATSVALAKYHAAARLGIERAKRGMNTAVDQNASNSHKEALDRYKRALGHIKNAKKVDRGHRGVPGNLGSHMTRAHDELRVAHELSGLKKRSTGKRKYFPGTEF